VATAKNRHGRPLKKRSLEEDRSTFLERRGNGAKPDCIRTSVTSTLSCLLHNKYCRFSIGADERPRPQRRCGEVVDR